VGPFGGGAYHQFGYVLLHIVNLKVGPTGVTYSSALSAPARSPVASLGVVRPLTMHLQV